MSPSRILQQIAQDLGGGNIVRAERLCTQLLSDQVLSFDAHCFLGVIRERQGRLDESLHAFRRASEINPQSSDALMGCGRLLDRTGHHQKALECYEKILVIDARSVGALNRRALALHKLGRVREAIASYTEALGIEPTSMAALCNRGTMYLELNSFEAALDSFDQALKSSPDYVQALNGRGNALRGLGRLAEALDAYDELIRVSPDSAEGHCNRGIILTRLKQFDEALRSFDKAIAVRPLFSQAWNNKGNLLHDMGKLEEALSCFDTAIQINNKYAEALSNRGRVLRGMGRVTDAVRSYNAAIALAPGLGEASLNKALCLLLMGQYEEGWKLYEKRRANLPRMFREADRAKLWDGEAKIRGKNILLCAEQGLGDTIQFSRYGKLAEERDGRAILAVHPRLMRLLRGLNPKIKVVDLEQPLPEFDYYIPLMSMPFACKTTLENIPTSAPHLHPEDELVWIWGKNLGQKNGLKVGICWQGNRSSADGAQRSIPLEHFARLASIQEVRLISLQKGDGVEQLRRISESAMIETLGSQFDAGPDAFIDTAAVMANLDLVITSDTAIAHLAGALGCRTWLVLPFSADWRWLMHRSESPWYPTMRIFRQASAGDWVSVFDAIVKEVDQLARANSSNAFP